MGKQLEYFGDIRCRLEALRRVCQDHGINMSDLINLMTAEELRNIRQLLEKMTDTKPPTTHRSPRDRLPTKPHMANRTSP